jgi:heme-degrading monooxygenase HmoA
VGYEQASEAMIQRVSQLPGFLGFDSVRGADGKGITVSYWATVEALKAWGRNAEHREIQDRGRREWYKTFRVQIAQVDGEY